MCEEVEKIYEEVENIKQRQVFVYLASPLTEQKSGKRKANAQVRSIISKRFTKSKQALFMIYDPAQFTNPGSKHTSREVYLTDYKKVFSSDLILFHVNSPSIGLGIEKQFASALGIPSVLIHPKSIAISRMFLGMPTNQLATIEYENIKDLTLKLDDKIPEIARSVVDRIPVRRHRIEEIKSAEIGRKILRHRIRNMITLADFSKKSDLTPDYIRLIERYDECAVDLSLYQLRSLAEALNCMCYPILKEGLKFSDSIEFSSLDEVEKESIDTLIDFVNSRNTINESRIFTLWNDYMEMRQYAIAGREELNDPLSTEDWKILYNSDNRLF